MAIETLDELHAALANIPLDSDEQRNTVVCALVGHSKIMSTCFGYWHCGRCEAQLGDSLGGVYDGGGKVVIGHNCETCRENYAACTWRDTVFAPDPFAV